MRTDSGIRSDLECELQWAPGIDDKKIAVIVEKGIVTLMGEVKNLEARLGAENVARRIAGVRAIANEIAVHMPLPGMRSDSEIALAAANALRWNVATIDADVTPVVRGGHITLLGDVHWAFQRYAAEYAVRHLVGVIGVTNSIAISATIDAGILISI